MSRKQAGSSWDEHRCPECGAALRPGRAHVRVDPRGVFFPRPVPGVTCEDCGRTFAAPDAWRRREAFGASELCSTASDPVTKRASDGTGGSFSSVVGLRGLVAGRERPLYPQGSMKKSVGIALCSLNMATILSPTS